MAFGPRFLVSVALWGLALATDEKGLAFLAEKAKDSEVVSLASGLMYKALKKGDGKFSPTKDSPCEVHYAGALIDGTEFDSSYKRGSPTTFAPKQVIKGWTEAMQLMVEGDKWEMYIPSDLAYGDRGSGAKIPGGSALIFELELIAVQEASWRDWLTPKWGLIGAYILYMLYSQLGMGADPETKKFSEKFLAENKKKEGVVTLPSGLQYKVIRAGTGDAHPLANSSCECHYEGRCAKDYPAGKKFDSSYDRGQPTSFAPNQVIGGWTEAMQLMVEGDKWEMYIPSSLAYGDTGRVPGCLVFTMEIIKIKGGTRPKAKKDE